MISIAVFVAVALLAPAVAQAQAQRDALTSTASIRGRVVAADTGAPLRRARIVLSGNALTEPRMISTDSAGRFEFRDLPSGRYTVTASRNGFLRLIYGQKRPGGLGRPVDVAAGESVQRVDFALPRMSVVSGLITDESGEPLEGCTVTAYRLKYSAEGRQLTSAAVASSDASGAYRLLSLPPGEYWLQATSPETWTSEQDGRRESVSYAPTYYPGTAFVQGARPIAVPLSHEVSAVNFALVPGRSSSVSGIVQSVGGLPLAGRSVFLAQSTITSGNGLIGGVVKMSAAAPIRADGSFTLKDVPVGTYNLQVSVPSAGGLPAEAASVPMTVTDGDVVGVAVRTSAGAQVKGIIETESGQMPTFQPSRIQVSIRGSEPPILPLRPEGESGSVSSTWNFTVQNVFGRVLVRVRSLPDGWLLKHVYIGTRDITDEAVDPEDLAEGVRIVLTDKVAQLSGRVVDSRGSPVDDFTVVAFPADDRLWASAARFIRAVRAGRDRQFKLDNLAPMDYYLVALDDVEPEQWFDEGFLRDIRSAGTRLTLNGGETRTAELKLAR